MVMQIFRVKNKVYNENISSLKIKEVNKMHKINDALWKDYKDVQTMLEAMEIGSEGYKVTLEERDKIRNELIKLEQIKEETEVKRSQIESEDNREKVRNVITVGTFVVTTAVSVYTISKTFKFDQVATITSTLGRNVLNGVIPKLFKR